MVSALEIHGTAEMQPVEVYALQLHGTAHQTALVHSDSSNGKYRVFAADEEVLAAFPLNI